MTNLAIIRSRAWEPVDALVGVLLLLVLVRIVLLSVVGAFDARPFAQSVLIVVAIIVAGKVLARKRWEPAAGNLLTGIGLVGLSYTAIDQAVATLFYVGRDFRSNAVVGR
jgi:hypothetical protein